MLPERVSFAGALLRLSSADAQYKSTPDPGDRLLELLNVAILDDYQRTDKRSRDYPRKKQQTALGPPSICVATISQRAKAKQVKAELKIRLTA